MQEHLPCPDTNEKKRLATAQAQVAQMKEQNNTISEQVLEMKIRALPKKQQLAVKNCLLAAQRKSLKGMTYDDEWIVECLLMRMRSPILYEHLRREEIMVLPGRTCLQRYLQRFKGGFGLNTKVFAALGEKTKDMDVFSCHGGLVIDEIKLSEQLDVKSNGELVLTTITDCDAEQYTELHYTRWAGYQRLVLSNKARMYVVFIFP